MPSLQTEGPWTFFQVVHMTYSDRIQSDTAHIYFDHSRKLFGIRRKISNRKSRVFVLDNSSPFYNKVLCMHESMCEPLKEA